MTQLIPERIKDAKLEYDNLLLKLESLLRLYQAPEQNFDHDKEIYVTLQKLIRSKVPTLTKSSKNDTQYIPVFLSLIHI